MTGQIGACSGSMPSYVERCAPRRAPAGDCAQPASTASGETERLEYRSAELARVDGDTFTYARTTSLTYTRTSAALPAPVEPAPEPEDPTPPTQAPAAEDATNSPAPSSTVVAFRHVLINATSVAYWRVNGSSASTIESNDGAEAPSMPTPIEDAEPSSTTALEDAIRRISADDFDLTRARASERSVEVTMSLELRTAEGDVVKLDFRQLDVLTRLSARGANADGDDVRVRARDNATQRFVDMSIHGDLSDHEQSAIDELLGAVIEVANKFFRGDVGAVWARLQTLEFSPEELAEVSLRLSSTYRREAMKLREGDDETVRTLAARDRSVASTLTMLADDQRTLIEAARAHFDERSAVRLVKELLPHMLETPAANAAAPASAEASAATT